jgi:hypothetical protein
MRDPFNGSKNEHLEAYFSLRGRFEHAQGKIQREYWGVRLPIGVVLTERPRNRLRRWLRRAPTMSIHHTSANLASMPVSFHVAIHQADVLANRAGWSLGDLSRHTVMDRIFYAEALLFTLADDAEGRVSDIDGMGRAES